MADKDDLSKCNSLAGIGVTEQAGAAITVVAGSASLGFHVELPDATNPTEDGCVSFDDGTFNVDGGPSSKAQIEAAIGTTAVNATTGTCTP